MKAMKSGNDIILVLNAAEVSYLHHRLATSSFKTFADYRANRNDVPSVSRKSFAASFDNAVKNAA